VDKLIVGLTGGIGSGKSTVAKLFAQKEIVVVDADQCSRIVVEAGKPALKKITQHFGKDILQTDGSLNRAQLRKIIFENQPERQWLESLLHPLIFAEIILQLKNASSPYAMLESPLLIEAGQNAICNRTLVVDVTEEQQIERATARDQNTPELIRAIMQNQASRSLRLSKADDVIDNSQSPANLMTQVETLHQKYLNMSSSFTTTD